MWSNILDRISFLALFFVIVLLPVFALPFTKIPVETSKGLLLVVGLAISIIFWAVARFSDGKISIPKSWLLPAGFLVVVVVLLSAFFSGDRGISMFGIMLDMNSFWFIFAGFLLMFASSVILKDSGSARSVLFGVIISSAAVMIFQAFRFFLPETLSLGILGANTENVLGSFNALGLFGAFSILASLLILDFFPISRMNKMLLQIFIVISVLMVAAVNFLFAWEILGIFALIIFVYKVSYMSKEREEGAGKSSFPAFSFAIVMVSLLFFMSSQFVGGILPSRLNLINTEVSPTLGGTISVTKAAVAKDPVLGVGPNRFGEVWALHKSPDINVGPFWDYSFGSGSGVLPTFAATTGILGILSWIIFLVLFIYAGVKSVFANREGALNNEMIAFFVLALYLFIALFFYSTGSVLFLLALAFTGIFVGLSASSRPGGMMTILFLDDHRKSFFFILFLVLVMIVSAATAFKYVERLASVSYFRSTLEATTVPGAEASIGRALSLHVNDLYLRTYSQVHLSKINTLAGATEELTEAQQAELQTAVEQAINGAQLAVNYNPSNHLNHLALGNVYSVVSSLGVADAYEKAVEHYNMAKGLNPLNPGIDLALSRTALNNNKLVEARAFANTALELKPNFIDALLTLSQIARLENKNQEAITFAEQALALAPDNQDLVNYVASLKSGNAPANPPVTTPETPTN
ncbi:MAG: hypothetical protein WD991_01560 [Candidatus Paceibacterota bacterium]